MKRLIFIYTFFFFTIQLQAQDLHIYYDAQTELLSYESNGKTIQKSKVKSGSNIFLHIENYNNYLYDVAITSNEKTINVPANSSNSITQLFSGKGIELPFLNQLSTPESKATTPEPVNPTAPSAPSKSSSNNSNNSASETTSNEQAIQQLNDSYFQAVYDLVEKEQDLIEVEKKIKEVFKKQQKINVIAKEIKKIQHHPQLQPTLIKKLVNEYFQSIFNLEDTGAINLKEIFERTNLQEQLKELKEKQFVYQKTINNLGLLEEQITNLYSSSSTFMSIWKEEIKKSEKFLVNAKSNENTLSELVNKIQKEETIQYQADLRYEYEAINSNNFSYTYRTTAKEDVVVFDIKFKKKDLLENNSISNKTVSPIEVAVSGGFKINGSIDLSFGRFNTTPSDYFIRDNTIKVDEQGNIRPMLTSFLHFYKQSNGNTSLGGSVGAGFPLSGDKNISSLSFLAGPALVIGKSSRIVMSAGVMAGQIDHLAQGYQIGDTFISEVNNLPLKQKYELGYFFGISYNLKGN